MIRAVVDTSVLIRYLIRPSAAIKEMVEEHWINGEFLMVSSPELVAELEDVLGRGYIQRFIQPDEGQVQLLPPSHPRPQRIGGKVDFVQKKQSKAYSLSGSLPPYRHPWPDAASYRPSPQPGRPQRRGQR